MLADEYGTASNIKSRVNRLSVLSAITSTQQRLKLYNRVPNNGLVMWVSGTRSEARQPSLRSWRDERRRPKVVYECDMAAGSELVGTNGMGRDCANTKPSLRRDEVCDPAWNLHGSVVSKSRKFVGLIGLDASWIRSSLENRSRICSLNGN